MDEISKNKEIISIENKMESESNKFKYNSI